MVRFFWLPKEVWFYILIPILLILLVYLIFYVLYRRKKGTYYYNYIVDYVYSTLGIIFSSLLLCLLLGYSIATIQVLYLANSLTNNIIPVLILIILPIIPAWFLYYALKIYIKNLKRKEVLDDAIDERERELINKQN